MIVRELVTRFGFDVDEKGLGAIENGIGSIKGGLLGLGGVVATAAAGLFAVVKTTADTGDELLVLSQRTGIAVERLQGLTFAAKLSNVGADELALSLQFLNRGIFAAATGGGDAAKAFQRLGLSAKTLQGQAPDEALLAIADGFGRLRTPAERSAVAVEIFGRAGAKLIPLLSEGRAGIESLIAEQTAFGVLTEENARAGDDFNDSLDRLFAVLGSLKKAVGVAFLVPFREAIDEAREFLIANKDVIKQNLTGFIKGLGAALKVVGSVVRALAGSFASLVSSFKAAETVTKLVLGGIALLSGAAILSGIGSLVAGVVALGGALTFANIQALLIPTAIGAAIVAIGLIIEDVVGFFQGRDSVLGQLVEAFQTQFPGIAKLLGVAIQPIVDGIRAMYEGALLLIDAFKTIASVVADVLGPALAAVGRTFGYFAGLVDKYAGKAADVLAPRFAAAGPLAAAQAAGAVAGGGASVTAPITVVVPPGTDPGAVGPRVQAGVADGVSGAVSGASRVVGGGRKY